MLRWLYSELLVPSEKSGVFVEKFPAGEDSVCIFYYEGADNNNIGCVSIVLFLPWTPSTRGDSHVFGDR